MIVSR